MIHIHFVGRLTADPVAEEKRTTIRVAADGRKDKDGEKHTDFLSCVSFGKTAEFASKLVKGQAVFCSGTFQSRAYKGKDGTDKQSLDVNLDHIEAVTWPEKTEKTEKTAEQTRLPWEM